MPRHVRPMLATSAPGLPADQDPWAFELKWDGIRALGYWDGEDLRFETRNLRDVTVGWPELQPLAKTLGRRPALLDGEIVAFDDQGVPRFQLLQERMHIADPHTAARKAGEVPASYVVFDLLHLGKDDLMPRPLHERRAVLDSLGLAGPSWATSPSFPGEGSVTWEAARSRGMEGVVAKHLQSRYVPGARSKQWLKIKIVLTDEFVVGGWWPGEGNREGNIGSLLLGVPVPTEGGGLAFVGNVGTGFTHAELRRLESKLSAMRQDTSPFTHGPAPRRGSVFVRPEIVVEVAYAERTKDGVVRHPSYKGERIDKDPTDVA